jgi:hypothetical protein
MPFKGKIPAKTAVLGFLVTEETIFRKEESLACYTGLHKVLFYHPVFTS